VGSSRYTHRQVESNVIAQAIVLGCRPSHAWVP
jgi:hypothetical protein